MASVWLHSPACRDMELAAYARNGNGTLWTGRGGGGTPEMDKNKNVLVNGFTLSAAIEFRRHRNALCVLCMSHALMPVPTRFSVVQHKMDFTHSPLSVLTRALDIRRTAQHPPKAHKYPYTSLWFSFVCHVPSSHSVQYCVYYISRCLRLPSIISWALPFLLVSMHRV